MSLSEMVRHLREEVKRQFALWAFGREIAQSIEYGSIAITIYQGRVSEVDVTFGIRPEANQSPATK